MQTMRESWTDERLDDFRAEVNRRFDEQRDEMNRRFAETRAEMKAGFERLDRLITRLGLGVIAALIVAVLLNHL